MPAHDALRAGTAMGATVLGIEHATGTIEAGKRADLVALRGNALMDISSVLQPVLVMKGGQLVVSGADASLGCAKCDSWNAGRDIRAQTLRVAVIAHSHRASPVYAVLPASPSQSGCSDPK